MNKSVILCMTILLLTMALSGCKCPLDDNEETSQTTVSLNEIDAECNNYNFKSEISDYMGHFMSEYISDDRLEIEKRPLLGESTEGGEITRYRDFNGAVLRYRLIYYGEMGRSEDNYYFVNDYIYYTMLVEHYSSPIYIKEIEVRNREFEEVVYRNGVFYQYDAIKGKFSRSDSLEIPYTSLEEIESVFQIAGAKEEVEPDFSEYNILAINEYLLGGYYNGQWYQCEQLYPIIAQENDFKVFIDGRYQGIDLGRKESEQYELYAGPRIIFPNSPDRYNGYNKLVAYSGTKDFRIENGIDISTENEYYRNELEKYLVKSGYTEDFKLTRILKIDMDDDGQDEVIIQAYCFVDPNDKSVGIQYMRKVVDGEIKEFAIPISQPTVASDYLTLEGFFDLDGDGTKELLVSSMGIGYHGYMVYEFKNNQFAKVLENGGDH